MPGVFAIPQSANFPDINFNVFSEFIQETFGSNISLATVLALLFTLTENPEQVIATRWIKSLARAVLWRFKDNTKSLFKEREFPTQQHQQMLEISNKLNYFAKLMGLTPYTKSGKFKQKLLPISHESIKAVHVFVQLLHYYADYECFKEGQEWKQCYLNTAHFLKIGKSIWIDHNFSKSVLNGIYNFYASAIYPIL
ncbi:hypothetical protein CVT25_005120 [Psilocybe cyanescens]|uniref:CxC5 like cysteine cluster associated with KDZ domain-containing protein n=1 Tax=Psilocybe cyanescens TaxID=93625 RepID=A0A409W8A5_PSICY|nr:hypothetical protein CVT25_005120 [Psilocybe cyanescens]